MNNPLGPDQGELKVVRGGSFLNEAADLRGAARFALDPDEAYNEVGFRCVPIGQLLPTPGQVAFCQPNYIPFCTDPNNPGGDCTPPPAGEQPTGGPDFEWLGFTCPRNGFITFTIDAGGPAAEDHVVTINGIEYNCVDSTVNPGRLVCTGTAQSQNTFVTISVCPAGDTAAGSRLVALTPTPAPAGDSLVAYAGDQQPQAKLVAFAPQQETAAGLQGYNPAAAPQALNAFQAAASAYCPEGMIYNPDTQQCESNPDGACPEGWSLSAASNQCVPDGGDDCPAGTTYSIDQQACIPDDGSSCPAPYIYDEASGLCQPPANDNGGGLCPDGYFYDRNIMCCSPIQGGNNGCAEGSYLDAASGSCQPLDESGCPEGSSYNRYEGKCMPDNARQQEQAATDQTIRSFNPGQGSDGQCGPGFYYDERMGSCRPTDGPGSGCAIGYAFSERLNCCVPTPGNDGSSCLGEQPVERSLQGLTNLAAPSLTGFDYGRGYCDPGTNGGGDGQQGCPDGYALNPRTQVCEPLAGAAQPQPVGDDGACAEGYYYDEAYGACLPQGFQPMSDSCGEGQYFDYSLGYCVQASCGCALGYTFNYDTQTCEPEGQVTTGGCWVTIQSVPSCPFEAQPTPVCDSGTSYQPSTGTCVRDAGQPTQSSGGGGPNACASYGTSRVCAANGCTWVIPPAGGPGSCQ